MTGGDSWDYKYNASDKKKEDPKHFLQAEKKEGEENRNKEKETQEGTAEMGKYLAGKAGKNRVSAWTGGGKHVDIGLQGRAHYNKLTGKTIETPHVHESKVNVGKGGTSLSDKTTRAATKQDIRTVRKIVKRRE